MKRFLRYAVMVALSLCVPVMAMAKKDKDKDEKDDKVITAKVWFKDGTVYEGELVKHWRTTRQTYLNPGHNFHTPAPDGGKKTVKHEAAETDSILILTSTHETFKPGDFYIAYNGKGRGALHKMLRCTDRGRYADVCRLPYWGNCTSGQMQLNQFMEAWYVRFRDTGDIYNFADEALQKGCNKSKVWIKAFCKALEKDGGMTGLADAVMARFCPDKATSKESAKLIQENPRVLLDFIDDYIAANGKGDAK